MTEVASFNITFLDHKMGLSPEIILELGLKCITGRMLASWVLGCPKGRGHKMQHRQTCCNKPGIKLKFHYLSEVITAEGSTQDWAAIKRNRSPPLNKQQEEKEVGAKEKKYRSSNQLAGGCPAY